MTLAASQHLIPNRAEELGFTAEQRVHDIRTRNGALTKSNRFKHTVIDDVTSRNIKASLQNHLLDLFESAMKSAATTLVREAKLTLPTSPLPLHEAARDSHCC